MNTSFTGPAVTRPPIVSLSEENIRHLRTFPRPPGDNGIGLHFHLDLRDFFIEKTVEHLKEIRATWTCIYAQDELQTELAARPCFEAGIMPVVRIGRRIDEGTDPVPFVHGLRKAWKAAGWGGSGAAEPLYIQLFNEPEDPREWLGDASPPDWSQRFGARWAALAPQVVDAGGFVGIQVLDRKGFDEAVNAVARNGREDIWKKAFFVHHNYGQNHPPAYPYDEIKQRMEPGKTILDDHVAALKFLAHAVWMQERLGFVLPTLGGEGGWWMYNDEDKHYPKVEWPVHAAYHKEMYEWFRTGVLSNGEPLPDYLFSITSWIAGSWTFAAQNWWDNTLSPTGKLDQSIEAMKSIPEFVRRFSWDEPGSPPVEVVKPPVDDNKAEPEKEEPGDQGGGSHPELPPDEKQDEEKPPVETPALKWDPRLDVMGIRLERVEAAHWRLVEAEYWDEVKSDGKHHIYVKALRKDGRPAAGVTFVGDWVGREPDQNPARGTTDANGETNLPMFIHYDPDKKDGIIFTRVEGAAADMVRGMGLPWNHHVCFVLTYQEV